MSQPGKPVAFMSYTRSDDKFLGEALTRFREELSETIHFLSGKNIEIFQDVEGIRLGQNIRQRIKESMNEVMILIPILTPSYFSSEWCREELALFLERERQLQRNDLILSIYYQRVPELDEAMNHESVRGVVNDRLIQELAQRLICDWRLLQRKEFTDPKVRDKLAEVAQAILTVLNTVQSSGQSPAQTAPQTPPSQPEQPTSSAQPVAKSSTADPPEPGKEVRVNRTDLRTAILDNFSLDELKILCEDLSNNLLKDGITEKIDLEVVGGDSKAVKVLNLIGHLDRRGYLSYLVAAVRRARPRII